MNDYRHRSHYQSSDPAVEGQKFLRAVAGISGYPATLLGTACVGARLFLPQSRQCYG